MHSETATLYDVAGRSRRDLEQILVRGETPDRTALAGSEYLGLNTPRRMEALGIRRFIKAFDSRDDGTTFGCNTPVVQRPPAEAWTPRPSPDGPRRYAFFEVQDVDPSGVDNAYLHALLLDYAAGARNGAGPTGLVERSIRDYLVRVDPTSDDVLLGKAYLALARRRVFSNFFVLVRRGALGSPLPQ